MDAFEREQELAADRAAQMILESAADYANEKDIDLLMLVFALWAHLTRWQMDNGMTKADMLTLMEGLASHLEQDARCKAVQ